MALSWIPNEIPGTEYLAPVLYCLEQTRTAVIVAKETSSRAKRCMPHYTAGHADLLKGIRSFSILILRMAAGKLMRDVLDGYYRLDFPRTKLRDFRHHLFFVSRITFTEYLV